MRRKVLILLDYPWYSRLADSARQDDREIHQQAQYLLKRSLEDKQLGDTPPSPENTSEALDGVGAKS